MIFFRLLLFFLFLTTFVEASVHEDAEDKKTSRWKLIHTEHASKINNVKDLSKKSRVLEFKGDGTKQAYEFKARKKKKNEYWLSWEMQFSEDFVIIVGVESNIGNHYIVYTSGTFKGHMQYGLGKGITNGKWQTIKRNLQKDIAYFDNRVKKVLFKSFIVKGNGKIDNILTKKMMSVQIKKEVKRKKKIKKVSPKKYKKTKVLKEASNSSPVISLRGMSLVKLSLGDTYIEEGVSAYDKEDGELNVVSMENINSNEVGRYMVLYMATDSHGNIALDKRYVHVGEVEMNEVDEDSSSEKNDFSEEEEQIKIWEKELALREKELTKKEKKGNKN